MTHARNRTRAPLLALSAGIVLTLSGCSVGLTSTPPATADPAYTADTPTAPSRTVTSRAPVAAAPTATLGEISPSRTAAAVPLAGADFLRTAFEGHRTLHLRFDVLSLARQGQLVELTASVTNLEPVPSSGDDSNSLAWNVEGLSDQNRGSAESRIWTAYSGTTLVDVASKKRYLVAIDSRGTCLCTPELSLTYRLSPGTSLTLNATYAAPPATTTRVTVDVPGIGSFADVPIS